MTDVDLEQRWKPSQFNEYPGQLSKDNWVIYNNLSGAMIEIERELYDNIQKQQLESLSNPEHIRDLSHGKIIVPAELDEVEALKKVKEKHIEKGFFAWHLFLAVGNHLQKSYNSFRQRTLPPHQDYRSEAKMRF